MSIFTMADDFDREKVVDCMFDPVTSSLLAELESGKKTCMYLAETSSISENEVLEKLSYLLEHDFIFQNTENDSLVFSANIEKLNQIVENSENFDGAINGLEKMDSYLN